jgi:hypothetical protein
MNSVSAIGVSLFLDDTYGIFAAQPVAIAATLLGSLGAGTAFAFIRLWRLEKGGTDERTL